MTHRQGPDGKPAYREADAQRLAKRLRKHRDHLLTFLDKPELPFENSFAERVIRQAVFEWTRETTTPRVK